MLSEDVAFESDLYSVTGRGPYLESAMLWKQLQEEELQELEFEVLRVSEVGYGKALVQWQLSWVPPGLSKIVEWGRSWPGMKIEKFDILDKYDQISRFSWIGLFQLFRRAIFSKVLRVPIARIIGTTTYTFDIPEGDSSDSTEQTSAGKIVLRRQKESLSLIPLFISERVQNRRITRDTILFLDTRRPPRKPTQLWDELIWDTLRASSVPGMKQLDIDGLSSEDSAQVYEDVTLVLGFVTFCVLVLGTSIGWLYFQQLAQQAAYLDMTLDY